MMHGAKKKIEDRGWRIARGALERAAILSLLSSILVFPAGCNVAGALASKVVPEPAVAARYVPSKQKRMLVLVENYRNPDAARMDAQRLTAHLAAELRRHGIAPVVDPNEAEALRARPDYPSMKVQEVGRAAGAGQVLYVNLQQFAVDDTVGGEMTKARGEMRVRVVDVATGQTLWPRSVPEGSTVTAETPWVRTASGTGDAASEIALRDQLARSAANQIVKLFRACRPDEEHQELEETIQ